MLTQSDPRHSRLRFRACTAALVALLAPFVAVAADDSTHHACELLTAAEIEADFGFVPAMSSEREITASSGPLEGVTASVCVWELDSAKVSVIVRPESVPSDRPERYARQKSRAERFRAAKNAVEEGSAGSASCLIVRDSTAGAPADANCISDAHGSSYSIDAFGIAKAIDMLTLMKLTDRINERLR